MRRAIIDSSAFMALEDVDAQEHGDVYRAFNEFIRDRVPLLTTNFVFDESYTLILSRLGRSRAISWGDALTTTSVVEISRTESDDERDAWDLLRRQGDKDYSYTDATSFALARKVGVTDAISLDHHFRQFGEFTVWP